MIGSEKSYYINGVKIRQPWIVFCYNIILITCLAYESCVITWSHNLHSGLRGCHYTVLKNIYKLQTSDSSVRVWSLSTLYWYRTESIISSRIGNLDSRGTQHVRDICYENINVEGRTYLKYLFIDSATHVEL